eukprot:COSAG01_NODE_4504_length_4970_cov_4.822008_8_plen_202_part_00
MAGQPVQASQSGNQSRESGWHGAEGCHLRAAQKGGAGGGASTSAPSSWWGGRQRRRPHHGHCHQLVISRHATHLASRLLPLGLLPLDLSQRLPRAFAHTSELRDKDCARATRAHPSPKTTAAGQKKRQARGQQRPPRSRPRARSALGSGAVPARCRDTIPSTQRLVIGWRWAAVACTATHYLARRRMASRSLLARSTSSLS